MGANTTVQRANRETPCLANFRLNGEGPFMAHCRPSYLNTHRQKAATDASIQQLSALRSLIY